MTADGTRLLLAGADEYLTKPLDVAEFIGMMDRVLGRTKLDQS